MYHRIYFIFFGQFLQAPEEVQARLPQQHNCKRVMTYQRGSDEPPVPETLRDLIIEEPFTQTSGDAPQSFLAYDNGSDTDSRVIIYATSQMLQKLCAAETWYMDGNFSVAPQGFAQLYVIRVPLGESAMTAAYVFLQRKNQAAYEEMLEALLDQCEAESYYADPDKIVIDFELSMIQAIRLKISEDIHIQCCFYHLTQATWRKVQELGLATEYKENEDLRTFVGMIDGLALLPEEDVPAGMQYLRDNCPLHPPAVQDLVNYFDSTYVTGRFRQLQQPRLQDQIQPARIRRIPPRFPLALWNVHNATINDEARTNNLCEGWNNKFMHLVGQYHPSIWRVIRCVQKDQATTHVAVLQDLRGMPPKKRRKRATDEYQHRLRNLCQDSVHGRKDIRQFLRGVGHNIRLVRVLN